MLLAHLLTRLGKPHSGNLPGADKFENRSISVSFGQLPVPVPALQLATSLPPPSIRSIPNPSRLHVVCRPSIFPCAGYPSETCGRLRKLTEAYGRARKAPDTYGEGAEAKLPRQPRVAPPGIRGPSRFTRLPYHSSQSSSQLSLSYPVPHGSLDVCPSRWNCHHNQYEGHYREGAPWIFTADLP